MTDGSRRTYRECGIQPSRPSGHRNIRRHPRGPAFCGRNTVPELDMEETKMLQEELKNNAYPGRGIIIGRTTDGKKAVAAY